MVYIPFRKTYIISNTIIKRKKRVSITLRQVNNNSCQNYVIHKVINYKFKIFKYHILIQCLKINKLFLLEYFQI